MFIRPLENIGAFFCSQTSAGSRGISRGYQNSESWDVNRHTARCTSPVSVVWQCKLVSDRGLRERRSTPLYEPYGSGRTLRFFPSDLSWSSSACGRSRWGARCASLVPSWWCESTVQHAAHDSVLAWQQTYHHLHLHHHHRPGDQYSPIQWCTRPANTNHRCNRFLTFFIQVTYFTFFNVF